MSNKARGVLDFLQYISIYLCLGSDKCIVWRFSQRTFSSNECWETGIKVQSNQSHIFCGYISHINRISKKRLFLHQKSFWNPLRWQNLIKSELLIIQITEVRLLVFQQAHLPPLITQPAVEYPAEDCNEFWIFIYILSWEADRLDDLMCALL